MCKLSRNKLEKKGFTLVEMLAVIAIIGILAAVVMVGIGNQRRRARVSSALESVRSIMPYAAECYLKGGRPLLSGAGTDVCSNSLGIEWPVLPGGDSSSDCEYVNAADLSTGEQKVAFCGGDEVGFRIYCDVKTTKCEVK